jgi:hypothetical protein
MDAKEPTEQQLTFRGCNEDCEKPPKRRATDGLETGSV